MRHTLPSLAAFIIIAALAAPALAEVPEAVQPGPKTLTIEPARRLGFVGRLVNGAKNIIIAPLDIPFTVVRHATDSGNPVISIVSGTLEGVVNGSVRLVAGALEVVTSPVPGKRHPLYERAPGERCVRRKPAF